MPIKMDCQAVAKRITQAVQDGKCDAILYDRTIKMTIHVLCVDEDRCFELPRSTAIELTRRDDEDVVQAAILARLALFESSRYAVWVQVPETDPPMGSDTWWMREFWVNELSDEPITEALVRRNRDKFALLCSAQLRRCERAAVAIPKIVSILRVLSRA